jgi:hypothetical protein
MEMFYFKSRTKKVGKVEQKEAKINAALALI